MEQRLLFGDTGHKQRDTKVAMQPAPKKLTPWKPTLSEREVTKQIRDWMELKGWVFVRRTPGRLVPWQMVRDCLDRVLNDLSKNQGVAIATVHDVLATLQRAITVGGEDGDPDWLAVHPEYPPVWIEMKRAGEKPRPNQVLRHAHLEQGLGFIVIVASGFDQYVADYRARVVPAVNDNAPRLRRRLTLGARPA